MANKLKIESTKYVATVGIDIDEHDEIAARRIEKGALVDDVCACHLSTLVENGDLILDLVEGGE